MLPRQAPPRATGEQGLTWATAETNCWLPTGNLRFERKRNAVGFVGQHRTSARGDSVSPEGMPTANGDTVNSAAFCPAYFFSFSSSAT